MVYTPAERMRRIVELFAELEAAVRHSHAIREAAEALSREAADLARVIQPERRSVPRVGLWGFTPQQWRRHHDHGRVDKVIQTNRENVEIFIVVDGRHRRIGSAASRDSAERMLSVAVDDRHYCSSSCSGWELLAD